MSIASTNALSRLYGRPGFLLRRAHQISAAVFEDECAEVGLTPAQFSLMTALRALPGTDQSRLSRAVGFDKVTTLRVLRGLEERRLVMRDRAADNARSLSLSLSDEGEELMKLAQRPADRAYRRLMAPLTEPQQRQLLKLLTLLNAGLESHARAPFMPGGDRPAER